MDKRWDLEKIKNFPTGLKERFKLFFKADFFHSKLVLWLLGVSFFFNLSNWVILFIFVKPVASDIILHYNVYFGVDSIGNYRQTYIFPLIGLVLWVINSFAAKFFYGQKERIAGHIMLMSSLMIQLSLIVASISIIIINY